MARITKWHQVKYNRYEVMMTLLPVWLKSNEADRDDMATIQDDALFINTGINEFYSGKISEKALINRGLKDGNKLNTNQHRYPRKLAFKNIMNWLTFDTTFEEWEAGVKKYLTYDRTTRKENDALCKFQKEGTFTTFEQSYIDTRITLVDDPKFTPRAR